MFQDGCQGGIGNGTIWFLDPETVDIDTKIMNLCCLEAEIWQIVDFNGGHFEIQNVGNKGK